MADWSWRLLFLGDGATTLLYGVVVYLFIGETRPSMRADCRAPRPRRPRRARGATWSSCRCSWCRSPFRSCSSATSRTLPLTITLSAGYPARLYGVLVAVNGLLIALFEMSVVERLRPLPPAARGRARHAPHRARVLVWPASPGTGRWFLLVVVAYTAGEILTSPQKMAFVTDWAPPASRGRYLSFYQATWSMAMGLNPHAVPAAAHAPGRCGLLAAHDAAGRALGAAPLAARPRGRPPGACSAGRRTRSRPWRRRWRRPRVLDQPTAERGGAAQRRRSRDGGFGGSSRAFADGA